MPIGQAGRLADGWVLRVLGFTQNATAQIASFNGNTPSPGSQFAMARVAVTNRSASPQSFYGYRLWWASASGKVGSQWDACGDRIPDGIDLNALVAPGETLQGNACWEVPVGEASRLVIYDAGWGFDTRKTYFSVR